MTWPRYTVMVTATSVLCCGCSSSVTNQETPEKCVVKWHKAIVEGDRRAFFECYERSQPYDEMLAMMYTAGRHAMKFGNVLEATFGIGSWDEFERADSGEGVTPLFPPWHFSADWGQSRPLAIEGDEAEVELYPDGTLDPIYEHLVSRNGQWFFDPSRKGSLRPEAATQFFKSISEACERGIKECRRNGSTLDGVKREFGKQLLP